MMHRRIPSHAAAARWRGVAIAALLVTTFACTTTSDATANVSTGQQLLDLSEAVNALRQDNAVMQSQIDSLGGVVARQDSMIVRIAQVSGIVLPPHP